MTLQALLGALAGSVPSVVYWMVAPGVLQYMVTITELVKLPPLGNMVAASTLGIVMVVPPPPPPVVVGDKTIRRGFFPQPSTISIENTIIMLFIWPLLQICS